MLRSYSLQRLAVIMSDPLLPIWSLRIDGLDGSTKSFDVSSGAGHSRLAPELFGTV
jgi:hypothetical protein